MSILSTKTIKRFIIGPIVLYLIALGLLVTLQRNFLYFPNGTYQTPTQSGFEAHFKEIKVTTQDDISLKGWYAPPTTQEQTIVFFHGNADSLRSMAPISTPYLKAGYGFLITEYRGYSGFAGSPTEEGLYKDARAFVRAALAQGIKEDNLIFWGHSMGTGVATEMATEFKKASGLMLLAPYTSIPEMAQVRFPFFPVKYLVWDQYRNDLKVPNLTMPLLIVHGTADIVIPFWQGHVLFGLAQKPKEFHIVPNGGHNNLFEKPFATISLKWLENNI